MHQALFGNLDLSKIAKQISEANYNNFNVTAISGVTSIAKKISQQNKAFEKASNIAGMNFYNQNFKKALSAQPASLAGLSQSLKNIAEINKPLSKQLSEIAKNQVLFSNNISNIAKSINLSHLKKFNGIDIALQGISYNYLKSISQTKNWNELLVAEQVSEVMSATTSEFITKETDGIAKEDLVKLQVSIISELEVLLEKSTSEKALNFIFRLMVVITFLINLYRFNQDSGNSTINSDYIFPETKKEIEETKINLTKDFEKILGQLNEQRIAKTDVHLRYSNKIRTNIIGVVKKGQLVSVIEIKHKYLLISYIDNITKEPKSGFVIKKYFERIK